MGYIDSGKKDGETLYQGGDRNGDEGYFIQPTDFTYVKPDLMKIVKEEMLVLCSSLKMKQVRKVQFCNRDTSKAELISYDF